MDTQPQWRTRSSRTSITVRVAARTDVGLVREHNEDSYLLADLSSGGREARHLSRVGAAGILLGVCDGMGGAAAGEVASRIAAKEIAARMQRLPVDCTDETFARALVRMIELAGASIQNNALANPSRQGMGTTATIAAVRRDRLFVGQVGDSRAYLLRRGELTQLTKDQSLLNQLIELGKIKANEVENFPATHVILQALGSAESIWVDVTCLELRRGDRLIVCSDGLTGPVANAAICRALTEYDDLDACAERLIELAKAAGGRDNITVVLCEFSGDGLALPSDGEQPAYQPLEPGRPSAEEDALFARPLPVEEQEDDLPVPGMRSRRRLVLGAALLGAALALGYCQLGTENRGQQRVASRATQAPAPTSTFTPKEPTVQQLIPEGSAQPELVQAAPPSANGLASPSISRAPTAPPGVAPRGKKRPVKAESAAVPPQPDESHGAPSKWQPPSSQLGQPF